MAPETSVSVRSCDQARLRTLLARDGVTVTNSEDDALSVIGLDSAAIGRIAADHDIALAELTNHSSTLEQIFMDLTADAVDYHAGTYAEAA